MTQQAHHSVQTMVAMGRRYRRQTQQDLADALTVETGQEWSRGQVGHIESGRRKLTVDELQVIARIQRLPVAWYFDEPTLGGELMDAHNPRTVVCSVVLKTIARRTDFLFRGPHSWDRRRCQHVVGVSPGRLSADAYEGSPLLSSKRKRWNPESSWPTPED